MRGSMLWTLMLAVGASPPRQGMPLREVLIAAGDFRLGNATANVAEFDISTGAWSVVDDIDLYLYSDPSEEGGTIWDIAVNNTGASSKLFMVGSFDTITKRSQVQYCSMGSWDGMRFSKVGEGLCPRGGDPNAVMHIQATVLGSSGDIFVGGSFESRVWNGTNFVSVSDVARFDSVTSSWLPLGGQLLGPPSAAEEAVVTALAWDAANSVLFIGGTFAFLDAEPISSGLAMWSRETGLVGLPGSSGLTFAARSAAGAALSNSSTNSSGSERFKSVLLAFEPRSQSLFVAGSFVKVNGADCAQVAVWHRKRNTWRCLLRAGEPHERAHTFSDITAVLLSGEMLLVAGRANAVSSWRSKDATGRTLPYSVAALDIEGYIWEKLGDVDRNEHEPLAENSSNSNSSNSNSNNRTAAVRFLQHRGAEAAGRRWHGGRKRDSLDQSLRLVATHQRLRLRGVGGTSRRVLASPSMPSSQSPQPLTLPQSPPPPPPSTLPSFSPWSPDWIWLPGFQGTDAPVQRLMAGRGRLEGSLFLSGDFSCFSSNCSDARNKAAVLQWARNGTSGESIVRPMGGGAAVGSVSAATGAGAGAGVAGGAGGAGSGGKSGRKQSGSAEFSDIMLPRGLVTAMVQVHLPAAPPSPSASAYDDASGSGGGSSTNNGPPKKDETVLILFSCLVFGVVLGVSVAVSWSGGRGGYLHLGGVDDLPNESIMTLQLRALTSGGGEGGNDAQVDFARYFERAMRARHLSPTQSTLLIIDPLEINLSRIIGEGSFGRVWSGHWRNSSVAVKEFVFAQAAMDSVERHNIIEEIVGEAGIMACLRHPKILQLYGCTVTMQAIWIVSELCSVGSLRMLLNDKHVELSLQQKLSICLDVADGMLYLHSRLPPIIHRDLKSHNVFITEVVSSSGDRAAAAMSPGSPRDPSSPGSGGGGGAGGAGEQTVPARHYVAKIGDWGSARAIAMSGNKSMTIGVGTACWLAPEVINYAHSSKGSDVYAFGILLWEVVTRREVHEGLSAAQIIARVANEGLRPAVPKDCPWANVMSSCWAQEPCDRPSFAKIMRSFTKIQRAHAGIAAAGGGGAGAGVAGGVALGAWTDGLLTDEQLDVLVEAEETSEQRREADLLAAIGMQQDRRAPDTTLRLAD